MPPVDLLFRHNPVLMWLERRGWSAGTTFPGAKFAIQRIAERQRRNDETGMENNHQLDLLDKFLETHKERPDVFTTREVLGLSLSTMLAGSETT